MVEVLDKWERELLVNFEKQVKETAPQLEEQNRVDLLFRAGVVIGLIKRLEGQVKRLRIQMAEEEN